MNTEILPHFFFVSLEGEYTVLWDAIFLTVCFFNAYFGNSPGISWDIDNSHTMHS